MNIAQLTRNALIISFVSFAGFAGTAYAQDTDKDLAAAVQDVKKAEADYAAKKGADREAMISDKFMDIHGSGWLYTKSESEELNRGLGQTRTAGPQIKPIKSDKSEYRIVAYSKDVVAVSQVSTTYYEVPNPQDVARAAGTMTDNPTALAKAAQTRSKGPGPGETESPNPYRSRTTRIWVRSNGHWQLALSTATRVGLKVVPGTY